MGTRYLILIKKAGRYKLAQFCQYDGHIDAAGIGILKFLNKVNLEKFKKKVSRLKFIDFEYLISMGDKWKKLYPWISPSKGFLILRSINKGADEHLSCFDAYKDLDLCDYYYLIDLDKNVFQASNDYNSSADSLENQIFSFNLGNLPKTKEYFKVYKNYVDNLTIRGEKL